MIFAYIILGDSMNTLIGNTPMIKIKYQYLGEIKYVFAKLEYYNLTGSIKDRMAIYLLQQAYQKGILKPGMPIIEATSGNTGISLAAIGAYYKHPVTIFMPDWVSDERVKLMKSFGASVKLISREEGGFLECIKRADALSREVDGYRPNQFSNQDNIDAHYVSTASEILEQLRKIDGFVSGIGTGGTLMGVGKRLLKEHPQVQIIALEPKESPLLTSGNVGSHKIEGIGDDFIPSIVDLDIIDDVYLIHDEDAINMSRMLARDLGLGVGISSGANMLGAILGEQKVGGNIVTVFPDDQKKYLSTKLVEQVEYNEKFLSSQIKLIDYEIIVPD